MFKGFYLFLILGTLLGAEIYDYDIRPSSLKSLNYMNIKILDSKELIFIEPDINELSALAYKDNILYALNDEGNLYHFDIKIIEDKIKRLSLRKSIKLKNSKSRPLKKSKRDSEGLAFMDDEILVAFEGKPRIELYSIDGKRLKKIKIDKKLEDIKNYKDDNKALESVAYNKKYGVVTAPETPLKGIEQKYHTIYSKSKRWQFPVFGKITALEFMSEDEVMILQRYVDFFAREGTITISRLNLQSSEYKVLAKMESKNGWRIDNFEGLTKVDEKRYLMVSDDNDSFLQKTLLVLFEVD